MKKKKTYLVFTIQGFNTQGAFPDGTLKLEDVVLLKLVDTTYDKALARAKKIVFKNSYRLSEVNEFFET